MCGPDVECCDCEGEVSETTLVSAASRPAPCAVLELRGGGGADEDEGEEEERTAGGGGASKKPNVGGGAVYKLRALPAPPLVLGVEEVVGLELERTREVMVAEEDAEEGEGRGRAAAAV